jgi:hypothetical protein
LPPAVAFVVALVFAVRDGIVGVVGTVVLMLVSLLFVIGGLGEAFAAPTADVPRAALVLSGFVAVALGVAVIVAAIARFRDQTVGDATRLPGGFILTASAGVVVRRPLAAASAHGLPRLARASVVEGSSPFEPGRCRHPGRDAERPKPCRATNSRSVCCR